MRNFRHMWLFKVFGRVKVFIRKIISKENMSKAWRHGSMGAWHKKEARHHWQASFMGRLLLINWD